VFSPDSKAVVTSSTDSTANFWNVATGRELFSASGVSQVLFSDDGNTLLLKAGARAQLFHVPTLAEVDAQRRGEFSVSD